MSAKTIEADHRITHRLLDALGVPKSASLAVRVSTLEARLLSREAMIAEIAEEAARLREELEHVRAALRHEATLLEDLEAEAARDSNTRRNHV